MQYILYSSKSVIFGHIFSDIDSYDNIMFFLPAPQNGNGILQELGVTVRDCPGIALCADQGAANVGPTQVLTYRCANHYDIKDILVHHYDFRIVKCFFK